MGSGWRGGGGGVERVLVGALAAAAAGRTSSSHEVFEFRRLKKVDSELLGVPQSRYHRKTQIRFCPIFIGPWPEVPQRVNAQGNGPAHEGRASKATGMFEVLKSLKFDESYRPSAPVTLALRRKAPALLPLDCRQ